MKLHPYAKDLTGQWHGRLFPFRPTNDRCGGSVKWDCLCECGNIVRVSSRNLVKGHTFSCGCLQKEATSEAKLLHGDGKRGKKARLYLTWTNMKARCSCPSSNSYQNYGDKDITYCDEWEDYIAFREWALANGYDDNLCIDRIDPDGNYEPANCQWITRSENAAKRWGDRR